MRTMKKIKSNYIVSALLTVFIFIAAESCKKDTANLEIATNYPTTPEVFIDAFSSGLKYDAWGKVTAFDLDYTVKYKGTASMKIEVPDASDPAGNFAGGVFYTSMARDLSGYDALTFWAKSTQPANMNASFGGYPDSPSTFTSKYKVAIDVKLNSNWQKYIIPIPDPSKLTIEKGMFSYSAGALTDGSGYTIWIDEVKFENLGTIAHQQPVITNAAELSSMAFSGQYSTIELSETFSLPNGVTETIQVPSSYCLFTSSDPNVATINDSGVVTAISAGTTKITAGIGDISTTISLAIVSLLPMAADPTVAPENVISLFSDVYTNRIVESWNPGWTYSTTVYNNVNINGNNIVHYTKFNFVGITFLSNQIDATDMTFMHVDIMTTNTINPGSKFKFEIDDFGADGVYGGGDDKNIVYTVTNSQLTAVSWISLEIPLAALTPRAHIAQLVPSAEGGMTDIYLDNMYFHK